MDPKPIRAGKTQEKPCRNGDGHAARKLQVISPEESNFPGSSSILMELLDCCFQSSLRGFSIVSSRFSARKQLPTCKNNLCPATGGTYFYGTCMNMWPGKRFPWVSMKIGKIGWTWDGPNSFQHLSALFRFTNIVRWLTPQVFLWAPPETCLPRLSDDVPPTVGSFFSNRLCVKRNDLPTTMRWEWCCRSLMSLCRLRTGGGFLHLNPWKCKQNASKMMFFRRKSYNFPKGSMGLGRLYIYQILPVFTSSSKPKKIQPFMDRWIYNRPMDAMGFIQMVCLLKHHIIDGKLIRLHHWQHVFSLSRRNEATFKVVKPVVNAERVGIKWV